MSIFRNLSKSLSEAEKAAAAAKAAASHGADGIVEGLEKGIVLPKGVKEEIAAEKQAAAQARRLDEVKQKEEIRTDGEQKRASARMTAAQTEASSAERIAQANTRSAERIAQANTRSAQEQAAARVAAERGVSRANYDAYLEGKRAEFNALPPRAVPTTIAEKLDDAAVMNNLHLTSTEYAAGLRSLRTSLQENGQLVERRKWTKDIPTTNDGRDIRSIEHRIHEGQQVTSKEFERLTTARVREHNRAQAHEIKLLKGNLDEPHSPAAMAPTSAAPIMHTGGGSGWGAFMTATSSLVNRIKLPQADIINPGLRYLPFNPRPATAASLAALTIAGALDVRSDSDLTLGPTARMLDNLTAWEPNIIEEAGDGKPGKEVGIGMYRSILMTNLILQNENRKASFAAAIDRGETDPGLKAIFLQARKQPIQATEIKARQQTATAELAVATAQEQVAATKEFITDAGISLMTRKPSEKPQQQHPALKPEMP